MAFIIAAVSQKGGSGKSNLISNYADALHADGKKVCVIDADPQGTAQVWGDIAVERGVNAPPVYAVTGAGLRKSVAAIAESFDVIFIDTAPRMTDAESQAAVALAHLVLVPVAPGPADVWALSQTADMIESVRSITGRNIDARVVLNRLDRNTNIAGSIREGAASAHLVVCDTALGNRVAFPEATAGGQGVVSYAPRSQAAAEVRELISETLQEHKWQNQK